jgi:hypothetical protein
VVTITHFNNPRRHNRTILGFLRHLRLFAVDGECHFPHPQSLLGEPSNAALTRNIVRPQSTLTLNVRRRENRLEVVRINAGRIVATKLRVIVINQIPIRYRASQKFPCVPVRPVPLKDSVPSLVRIASPNPAPVIPLIDPLPEPISIRDSPLADRSERIALLMLFPVSATQPFSRVLSFATVERTLSHSQLLGLVRPQITVVTHRWGRL